MNPELPPNPRAELEARITAFLLGELSAHEAAALRQQIDDDAQLAELYERLKSTVKLVREVSGPASLAASQTPLKLSAERQEKLLAHFKTITPKEFAAPEPPNPKIHWLLQLAAAAAIIMLLAGLILPSLAKAKYKSPKLIALAREREEILRRSEKDSSNFGETEVREQVAAASKSDLARRSLNEPALLVQAPAPTPPAKTEIVLPSTDEYASSSATRAPQGFGGGRSGGGGGGGGPMRGAQAGAQGDQFKVAADDRVSISGAVNGGLPITDAVTGLPLPPPEGLAPVTLTANAPYANNNRDGTQATASNDKQANYGFNSAGLGQNSNGALQSQIPIVYASKPDVKFQSAIDALNQQQLAQIPNTKEGPAPAASPAPTGASTLNYYSVGGIGGAAPSNPTAWNLIPAEKTPALGDVPSLGRAFRSVEDSKKSGNLTQTPLAAATPQVRADLLDAAAVPAQDRSKQSFGAPLSSVALPPGQPVNLESKAVAASPAPAVMPPALTAGAEGRLRSLNRPAKDTAGKPVEQLADLDEAYGRKGKSAQDKVGEQAATPKPAAGTAVKNLALLKTEENLQKTPAADSDLGLQQPHTPVPVPQPEMLTAENAFSTFSLNVADVSFKLAAASLEKGVMPDPANIRSEEFINAFDYRDPDPAPGAPLAFAWDRAQYPLAQNRDLLRFSVKTAAAGRQPGRPLNIVLLLDNSGSMERADRVQIIHEALRVLASQLQPQDKLSVVTFARTARLWVDGVSGDQAGAVAEQVSGLTPQGGTNLEEAMRLAYETALRHYLANGINRVVLLTDGAANLGNVNPAALQQKVEQNRRQGIALDCFGIGWEGYNDDLLEVLTRHGDGRYGFLNTPEEAATDFAGQLAGALHVAAADVKVQVEFNPQRVTAYRQVGYAKHQLTKEQFRDNTVDAAEIGAAESGNALYVIAVNPAGEGPLATVHVRYEIPGTSDYEEHAWTVPYAGNSVPLEQASPALRLAATAGAFAEWLAASPYAAEVSTDQLLGYLSGVPQAYGADPRPAKLEWMLRQAKSITGK